MQIKILRERERESGRAKPGVTWVGLIFIFLTTQTQNTHTRGFSDFQSNLFFFFHFQSNLIEHDTPYVISIVSSHSPPLSPSLSDSPFFSRIAQAPSQNDIFTGKHSKFLSKKLTLLQYWRIHWLIIHIRLLIFLHVL